MKDDQSTVEHQILDAAWAEFMKSLDEAPALVALTWAVSAAKRLGGEEARKHAHRARDEGYTWHEIGLSAGGVSRQAAIQRFGD